MSRLFTAFGTAFVAIGFVCAPIAALATFAVYVFANPTRGNVLPAFAVGLALGVLAGIGVWWIYQRSYRSARDVNPGQYQSLNARLKSDGNQIQVSVPPPATRPLAVAAQKDTDRITKDLEGLLEKPQPGDWWLSAEGYLEAWTDVYRLEEAMLLLVPVGQVLAMANDDLSRLEGSDIPNAANLKQRLTSHVNKLVAGMDDCAARTDIAAVRRSINQYRDDQWRALVRERNRAMLAAAIAGLLAYFGLISVLVWNIDPKALQVATALIVTGALVSLLHQVTVVGSSETGIEDFGQSTSRLLSATFVSGLIALLGVIIIQGAGLTINGVPLIQSFGHWKQTFDWTQNKGAFFWAALFGLTPSLLFQILQNRADNLISNLESSQAGGAKTGKG